MLRPLALTVLCFSIALAVMAFVQPVPVEPSPDTVEAGGPSHSICTGPVTYNNRGEW